MKWMVPENSLDAVQVRAVQAIVDNYQQNHWVKGFAGSGKTIVLTHVLERLAALRPPPRICFATYTHALKDMVESGLSDRAKEYVAMSTFDSLGKLRGRYDVLVADEMQDLKKKHLTSVVSTQAPLIIAADSDQSIHRGSLSDNDLAKLLRPVKEHQLREIHRINEFIFEVATTIYPEADVATGATVREDDLKVRVYKGSSQRDEFVTVFEEAQRVSVVESPSAILFPDKATMDLFLATIARAKDYLGHPPSVKDTPQREPGEEFDPYRLVNEYLEENDSPLQVFGSNSGSLYESDYRDVVYLMTYHSAKGLDFENVFLVNLTDATSLNAMKGSSDDEERRLFFVAATRARERLHISYNGNPHRFVEELPGEYLEPLKKRKRDY
jgi:superfamily I DNA/RNA helicase